MPDSIKYASCRALRFAHPRNRECLTGAEAGDGQSMALQVDTTKYTSSP